MWPVCKNGHDKRVVGTTGARGVCRECHNATMERQRRRGVGEKVRGEYAPEGLLRARRVLGLSVVEVSRRIGCGPQHYRGVEARRRRASRSFVREMVAALYAEMNSRGMSKLPEASGTPHVLFTDAFGRSARVGHTPLRARALVLLRSERREVGSLEVSRRLRCTRNAAAVALNECHGAGFASRREVGGRGRTLLYKIIESG